MRFGRLFVISLGIFAFSAMPAHADPGQLEHQVDAAKLQDQASDRSMESATGHAMVAVVSLASMNIPGAVTNGVAAYGNYRNSESLDSLTDRAIRNAESYKSLAGDDAGTAKVDIGHKARAATGASAAEEPKFGAKRTSFRRLNPKFLYEGEMNSIAADFEAKSGMTREQFLDALSTVSEQKISAKDPEVVEKAIGRFRAFIELVPNAEFKAGLTKALDSVPETVQKGFLAQAISKTINFVAEGGAGAPEIEPPALSAAVDPNPSRAPASPEEPLLVASATPAPAPAPAAATIEKIPSAAPLLYETDAKEANELLGLAAEEERTIFAMVSQRYRQLTPSFIAKNSVN